MRAAGITRLQRTRTARTRAGNGGFTMIELMVVVAIMAIMAALAAPSMTGLIAQQRLKSAATDLHFTMLKARGEAIKRNTNVTVSPTEGAWSNGWRIVDPVDAAAAPLDFRGPTSNISVTTSATQVIYSGTGRTTGASFSFSAGGGGTSRCVYIDASGRPTVKEGSC